MKIGKLGLALASASLVAAPVMAAPSAAPLSLQNAPAVRAAPDAEGNRLGGLEGGSIIAAVLAAAVVVAGVIIAIDGGGSDDPVSR